MKKTIIISMAAIICSIIIGGSFYAVEMNKQNSIEKQRAITADQLSNCLDSARQKNEDSQATALEYTNNKCRTEFTQDTCLKAFIEALDKYKIEEKEDIDNCYNRFK